MLIGFLAKGLVDIVYGGDRRVIQTDFPHLSELLRWLDTLPDDIVRNQTLCEGARPLYAAAASEFAAIRTVKLRLPESFRILGRVEFALVWVQARLIAPLTEMKRYAFVPFRQPSPDCDDYARGLVDFYGDKKKYVALTSNTSLHAGELKGIPLLSQIYVIGHCSPGSAELTSGSGEKQSAAAVANRFKNLGIPENYWGRVKVFGCSSGKSGPGGGESFAMVFGRFIKKKYPQCEVFGYTVDLTRSVDALKQNRCKTSAEGGKFPFEKIKDDKFADLLALNDESLSPQTIAKLVNLHLQKEFDKHVISLKASNFRVPV